MTHKAVSEILAKYSGARQQGSRVEVPAGREVTFYATLGEEGLVVDRVRSVDLEPEFVCAVTARGERFVVLYEDLRAIRFGAPGGAAGYER